MIKIDKSKCGLIFQILLHFLFALSFIIDSNPLLMAVIIGACIYTAIFDLEDSLLLLAGISIYDYAFNINGAAASYLVTIVFILKVIVKARYSFTKKHLASLFIIAILEIFGDLGYSGSSGEVVLALLSAVLFILCAYKTHLFSFDLFRVILLFAASSIAAIVCIISRYEGLSNFIKLLFTSTALYRFGIGNANVMGGAMGLPLYASMLLSLTIVFAYSTPRENRQLWKTILLIVLNAIECFFAILTISRSFYLCLAFILLGVLYTSYRRKKKISIKIAGIILLALIALVIFGGNILEKAFSLLQNRVLGDTDAAGRFPIWGKALLYLLESPLNLLFGFGACSYSTMEGVTAGAHNLILDLLMSWGIVGCATVTIPVVRILRSTKESYTIIPFLAFFGFSLMALRSYSLKTMTFLLISLFVISSLKKDEEETV